MLSVADGVKAAGGNVTSPTKLTGLEARVLKSLAKSRNSGSKTGAAGDEDMLWIGPVVISSLPMDVSSRDKHMKFEEVRNRSLLYTTVRTLLLVA
jgi:hypothetical protein